MFLLFLLCKNHPCKTEISVFDKEKKTPRASYTKRLFNV